MAKDESEILKEGKEAETALKGLMKELEPVAKALEAGKLDPARADAASKKVVAFMKRFSAIAARQKKEKYSALSPRSKAVVDWVSGLNDTFFVVIANLKKAEKAKALDPEKDGPTILVEVKKAAAASPRKAPAGVGTLVKTAKQGIDAGGSAGVGMSFLPMLILLWMIADTVRRGLKSKPKM